MKSIPLELLSPAKDVACGVAAIDHGADAVYIGGPQFSARTAAHNSIEDIRVLVEYAHQFGAKVYIALNTLFDDRELASAVQIIHQVHAIGADAVIIQDVGLLECELPPIALHASTQMNNRTPGKVRFLEKEGFTQVVLARELSLDQIRDIASHTGVALEFFIHGALCVSYSGQCYISEVMTGRSANRGECAQFCRHRYNLEDKHGKVLVQDRYLLSLKDLDLSRQLQALIDAGIRSFKIEGRLKDSSYVKNVTAHYRRLLDEIIARRPDLCRASSGTCTFAFEPDPSRTFNRGKTEYYLSQRRNKAANIISPKSIGKKIGSVVNSYDKSLELDAKERIVNGDGLCFVDSEQKLVGFRVNKVVGDRIYTRERVNIPTGTELYRNLDTDFIRKVGSSENCRFVQVDLALTEEPGRLALKVVDEDGLATETFLEVVRETARKPGAAEQTARRQLSKSGGTIFSVDNLTVNIGENSFYPVSAFNEIRRSALENHRKKRAERFYPRDVIRSKTVPGENPWLEKSVGYKENISNQKAKLFYEHHAAQITEPLKPEHVTNCDLMTTRYCVRAQLGICPNMKTGGEGAVVQAEPLILSDNNGRYEVSFNCRQCEMILRAVPKK